jgi:hypothetical protein
MLSWTPALRVYHNISGYWVFLFLKKGYWTMLQQPVARTGTRFQMNRCVQLKRWAIDFHVAVMQLHDFVAWKAHCDLLDWLID